jgi:hypothetical protein
MQHFLRCLCGIVFFGATALAAFADGPTRSDIAKLGKAATALVEAGNNTQGSAFCIHPAGFFVTNEHVVGQNSAPTLIINTGQMTEKVLQARVIRSDAALDLALLQVSGEKTLPVVSLGTDEGLTELAEVVAFGYPFGTGLAVGNQGKPAISINVGTITSLRQKGGELHRIQLDAVLNPGNSGGPVLDKEGKVVGVVVSGVRGAGVNFAIPVSHLRKFLTRPEIVFEPPDLRLAQVHEPTEFQVRAVSLLPSDSKPFDLEFYLFTEGKKARKFRMDSKDGIHRVRAEPIPKADGPAVLRLTAIFDRGTISGQVTDRLVQVGGTEQKLSDVRRILGSKKRAILHDGKSLTGELKNLEAVPVNLGPASVTLDLTSAREVRFDRPAELASLGCTIVAYQDHKEIGRLTHSLPIQGVSQAGEESVDLDIETPPLANDKEIREMAAPIKDVAVGGGGRYLILHLAQIGKLAIFDVNLAKVAVMLPAPEDNLKFTAGRDKLVVALPLAKTLQRWDLSTFNLDLSVPLVINGELLSLAMGSASQGPIVGSYRENTGPWVKFVQWTLDKLERRTAVLEGPNHPTTTFAHIRASGDGQALGLWTAGVMPTGVCWIKWEGQIGKVAYEHASRGHVVPGLGGKVLFTGLGMYTGITFPTKQIPYPGSDGQAQYLPALHGDFYMHLGRSPKPQILNPERSLTIYKRNLALPVLKRPDIDIPPPDPSPNFKNGPDQMKNDFTFDKRVLLVPQAKLLIIIPTSNDRLVLHRIDLEGALEKAGLSVQRK